MAVTMIDAHVLECLNRLRRLRGLPPFDGADNICRNDGYFASSILRDFAPNVRDAAEILCNDESEAWENKRKEHIARYSESPQGAWALTEEQLFEAVCAMKAHGGHFVHSLAVAFFHADLSNQRRLTEAFSDLLTTYYDQYVKKG